MVPLRLDVCDDRARHAGGPARPQLTLKDFTAERHSRTPAAFVRHSPFHSLENMLLAAAAAAVLLFFFFTFVFSLVHAIQQRYAVSSLPMVVMISKTVAPGDTLAGFARRYGDPNTYILAREEQITRLNHLTGTTPLLPGQRLLIPVTNPALIAQIEQHHQRSLVAKR